MRGLARGEEMGAPPGLGSPDPREDTQQNLGGKPAPSPAAEEHGPDLCKAGGRRPLCAAGLRCQPRGFLARPWSGASPLTGNGASTGRLEGGRRTRCDARTLPGPAVGTGSSGG